MNGENLFLDGEAKIDTLTVDESATVSTKLTVGTGVTIKEMWSIHCWYYNDAKT